jgi:flagellar protein FlaG
MQNDLSVKPTSADVIASIALQNQSLRANPLPFETPDEKRTEKEAPDATQPQSEDDNPNPEIDRGELDSALEQLNANVALINERYTFQVEQNIDQLVVQVKDRSGEVLRQVPPQTIVETATKINSMIGMFIDETI